MKSDCLPRTQPTATPLLMSIKDLVPGDILCFEPSNVQSLLQLVIQCCQGRCTHVAIVVGVNEEGNPVIAHITDKGYECQPINHYCKKYEKGDDTERAYQVYRFRDPLLREMIVSTALAKENKQIKGWSLKAGVKALVTPHKLDPKRKKQKNDKKRTICESAVCSTFAAQVLKIAMENTAHEGRKGPAGIPTLPLIDSRSGGCTPHIVGKELQAAVRDGVCETFMYPGVESLGETGVMRPDDGMVFIEEGESSASIAPSLSSSTSSCGCLGHFGFFEPQSIASPTGIIDNIRNLII